MITKQIKRQYCNLTLAERKVADHVIEFPQDVTELTVHQFIGRSVQGGIFMPMMKKSNG